MILRWLFAALTLLPSNAFAYAPHEYPAIYTQQLGRVFLFFSFLVVISSIVHYGLHKQKGWRFLFLALVFFSIWDLDVFVGRMAEFAVVPEIMGSPEGWLYFTRTMRIERFEALYYLGRLDFVLLNAAMLLYYFGLREILDADKDKGIGFSGVILPLLPILLTDMIGNVIFILLSLMSLYVSIELYRRERNNVLRNYIVWLSFSWVLFSISRAFGHVLRHILIPTGNEKIWKFFEPFSGSFNTFALFFVGSVSLFFIRIYKSYTEITEDKGRLEELLRERTRFTEELERDKVKLQELDRMKSAFMSNMSHELRTPMNTIIGYSEMLLDKLDGPLNQDQEKSLSRIRNSAGHLLRLIDDVLNIYKIETSEVKLDVKDLDAGKQIHAVVSSFEEAAGQKGLYLSEQMREDLPTVFGDGEKIRQILGSLLSNAVKFTKKGGITVTAAPSRAGLDAGTEPLFLEICVADTGIGIKNEDIEKIFDKFVQVDFTLVRQYEGTGLGLSIAKGLVELHKGSIWVTSVYGEGSRFCFTLPIKREILESS